MGIDIIEILVPLACWPGPGRSLLSVLAAGRGEPGRCRGGADGSIVTDTPMGDCIRTANGGNPAVFSLLSPLAVPLLLKPRDSGVSSAGECPKGMISYKNDNGAWLNAAEDHALALATPAHSPEWTVR